MTEIGTFTTKVSATTEDGRPLPDLEVTFPVHAWVPIRQEMWVRDGRRVEVESDANGQVMVSLELFRQILADLGFKRVDE